MMRSLALALVAVASASAFVAPNGFTIKAARTRPSALYMATVAVFGGTGETGKEVVYQALKQGEKVVVLARTPDKMRVPSGSGGGLKDAPLSDPKLTVIQGDVTKAADVDKAIAAAGDDLAGVVVALGGKTKDVGPSMLTDGTANVISAMKRLSQAKRIAVVTSIGAGDSEKQAPIFFKALMYTVMAGIFKDKNNQEALFTKPGGPGGDLEYTIVRPGGLGVGPPTGVINVIDGEAGSIQRADVAAFCLGAVLDKGFPYIRKTPCISSVGGTGWVKEKKPGFDGVTTA